MASAGQSARNGRQPAPHEHTSSRSVKTRSAQNMPSPRRESAAGAGRGGLAQQRPQAKGRAYSAPLVPKGTDNDDPLAGDDEEIAGDPFFQRYNFGQTGDPTKEEASSSSPDSSSDTEGPLSPTHMKARQPGPADALPSPRSPTASVAVGFLWPVAPPSLQQADMRACSRKKATHRPPCWTSMWQSWEHAARGSRYSYGEPSIYPPRLILPYAPGK